MSAFCPTFGLNFHSSHIAHSFSSSSGVCWVSVCNRVGWSVTIGLPGIFNVRHDLVNSPVGGNALRHENRVFTVLQPDVGREYHCMWLSKGT